MTLLKSVLFRILLKKRKKYIQALRQTSTILIADALLIIDFFECVFFSTFFQLFFNAFSMFLKCFFFKKTLPHFFIDNRVLNKQQFEMRKKTARRCSRVSVLLFRCYLEQIKMLNCWIGIRRNGKSICIFPLQPTVAAPAAAALTMDYLDSKYRYFLIACAICIFV